MARFDKFLYGFIPGLVIPVVFMWVYLYRFFPVDSGFVDALQRLYPTALFPKLLLLSVMPNLVLVFVLYKRDAFKIATGVMVSAMPYFITSVVMW